LCLRIVHQRLSSSLATPYRLFEEEFNLLMQDRETPAHLEDVHRYMRETRAAFERISASEDANLEAKSLVCYFRHSNRSFSDYAMYLAKELMASNRVRTARAYLSAVKRLSLFTGKTAVPFAMVTSSQMEAFERRMKEEGLCPNTISFYMRNLRAIYYKAMDKELVERSRKNPFKNVFTGFAKTRKRALDSSQMQQFQNMEYSQWLERGSCPDRQKLYTSWRLFSFCFHARGMCFVDMAFLKKENISKGVIRYYRKKTGGLIEVKVTPLLQKLMDSFKEETRNSPYVFPLITCSDKDSRTQYERALSRQNSLLKRLAKEAGIPVALTTHVSRHSWASIAKSSNTPLWVISEGLGHSNEKVTYTYLSSLERSHLDEANEKVCALVCQRTGNFTYAFF
jgi:integrase